MDFVLVVAVMQHRIHVQVFDLGDRGDVARDRVFNLDVLLAAQLEQVADLERLLAVVDKQLRVTPDGSLIDAEHAELADEGVVDDLEHVRDHVRLRIGRCMHAFARLAFLERRRVDLGRVGEQSLGDIQQFAHADPGARRTEQHRHQVAFAQALLERVVQLVAGQPVLAEFEVVLHHRLVDLDHLVDDFLVPDGHVAEITGPC